MAVLSSDLVIRLVDAVSGPARGVAQALRGIGTAARSLNGVTVGGLVKGMARDTRQLRSAVGSVSGALTAGVTGMGLYKLHHDVYEFAKATNRLAAANPDVVAEQIARIKNLSREITRTSMFDPATVMNAANSLARADVSIAAIEGALRPLATAAMAADVPINQLADDFVKLSSGFGLAIKTKEDAKETFSYLGDLAQYVSQKAPGTFNDFVQAMKQVGTAVTAAGVKIEWLAGAYVMLDKAGIRNQEAGVALKSLFKAILTPTTGARKIMAQLGVDQSMFTKRSSEANAKQLVQGLIAEYGKDFSKFVPELQKVIERGGSNVDMQKGLFKVLERTWGKMKPQDARKLNKSIADFIITGVDGIDPEKWIKALADKGVTFGQFLKLVEPRQALKLQNLMKKGDKGAKTLLETPLSQMVDFRRGLADEAAGKMMQGYPAAIAKLSAAWHTFIESLDKSGAIDKVASALTSLGESIARVMQGDGSLKDIGITLTAALPLIGPVALAVTGLASAFTMLGAAVKLAGSALLMFPLASLSSILGAAGAGGTAAGAAAGGAAGAAGAAAAGAGAIGLGSVAAAVAAIAGGVYLLNQATKADAGKTLGERLKEHRGGKSQRELLREHFNAERERLGVPQMEQPDYASQGRQSGESFIEGLSSELERAEKMIQDYVGRFRSLLNFNATPSVTPMFAPAPAAPSGPSPTRTAARGLYSDYDFGGDLA